MATEKRLIEYYVVRNKSTGFYFRGKGANRWGEYHNQASIYRIRAHAENTAKWLNLRGEPVEIVPIKIVENSTVDAVEVSEYDSIVYKLECLLCHATGGKYSKASYSLADMERMVTDYIEKRCDEAVAEEVVHGRWVPTYHTYYNKDGASEIADELHCSECGIYSRSESNYCPNCGADMRGRKDNG